MFNSLIKYTTLFEMEIEFDKTFWVYCYYLFLYYLDNTHNEVFDHYIIINYPLLLPSPYWALAAATSPPFYLKLFITEST